MVSSRWVSHSYKAHIAIVSTPKCPPLPTAVPADWPAGHTGSRFEGRHKRTDVLTEAVGASTNCSSTCSLEETMGSNNRDCHQTKGHGDSSSSTLCVHCPALVIGSTLKAII